MNMRRKDREVTDIVEINEILKACKTCHVAMPDGDRPYLIPLSYGYELKGRQLTLYFHSAKEGHKLELLKKNCHVCFEISKEGDLVQAKTPCNSGYDFSSLIGYGTVRFLENPQEKCDALAKMFLHQTGRKAVFTPKQAAAVCVYQIVSEEFTAKRKQRRESEISP